jgi:NTP pyrophosphatase (non-canonical NTP hydrolase)
MGYIKLNSELYQKLALQFLDRGHRNHESLTKGLIEEAYEVDEGDDRQYIKDELSDVLWYVTAIADYNGMSLEDVMRHNLNKLERRALNGKV